MALSAIELAGVVRDLYRRQGAKDPAVYWRLFFTEVFNHLASRLDLAEVQTPVPITASHTVGQRDELVLVGTSAFGVTVTLPSQPFLGQRVTVADGNGTASSQNITVQATTGTIAGVASQVLNTPYASLDLVWSGTAWVPV